MDGGVGLFLFLCYRGTGGGGVGGPLTAAGGSVCRLLAVNRRKQYVNIKKEGAVLQVVHAAC